VSDAPRKKRPVSRVATPPQSPFGRGDLPTSLLLVFPLFLAYEIGVLFSPTVNGVDFVTRWVFALVGYDRQRYLTVHLALAGAFFALLLWARRRGGFSLRAAAPPLLFESAIYALTLGTVILFIMDRVLGLALDATLGPRSQEIVMSLGAGVHEELVFRLGLMGGGVAALLLLRARRGLAVGVALAASSLLFAAAHHAGPLGEPFELQAFVYRTLAGVAFGLIFYYRSLAHAVYTHFLYDVYVLVIQS
jgi:hypothetical protein